MPENVDYKTTVDESDVLDSLKKMKDEFEDTAKAGEKAFDKTGDAADKAGGKFAALSGRFGKLSISIVQGLGKATGALSVIATSVGVINDLIQASIAGNRIEVTFNQIASDVAQSANEILNAITKASLGTVSKVDAMRLANEALRQGIARTPADFEKMSKAAFILGKTLGITTTEALAEFAKGSNSLEGFVNDNFITLGITAEQLGREMETLASDGLGKTVEELSEAERQGIIFEAVLNKLSERTSEYAEGMEDLNVQLQQAKAGFANVKQEGGEVLTIIGSLLSDLGSVSGGLFDQLLGPSRSSDSFFQELANQATQLQFVVLGVITQIAGAFEGLKVVASNTFEPIRLGFQGIGEFLRTGSTDLFKAADEARKTFNQRGIIDQFNEGFERGFEKSTEKLKKRFADIINPEGSVIKNTGIETGETLADGIAEGIDTSKARSKVRKATEKLAREAADSALDLQIRQERRLTDALVSNARKREDIARANAQEIADINRDFRQDIADEGTDLSRQEQQIARDGARQQSQIARDEANQRVDIERDFRQQLEQIRRTFEQSALEAERANDAQAFVTAVRQRDNSITDATTNRDSQIQEARTSAQRQREELKIELQNEIQDARIANQQKLEDLRSRLEQELAEQRIKNQRDLEEQTILEARKEADRLERDARELADFDRQQTRKIERLSISIKQEIEALANAEKAKTDIAIQGENRRIEAAKKAAAIKQKIFFDTSFLRGRNENNLNLPLIAKSRATGGPIGTDGALVGERGPELFVPNTAGRIIPNNQLFSPPAMRAMLGNVSNTTTNQNANVSMTPDLLNDPIMKQRLIEMVTNELIGGLR